MEKPEARVPSRPGGHGVVKVISWMLVRTEGAEGQGSKRCPDVGSQVRRRQKYMR